MNQAIADPASTDTQQWGQADAGLGVAPGHPSEASESEAGSNETTPLGQPGAAVPGDPGRAVDLDVVDENHADIESYLRDLEQFGTADMPESLMLDPEDPANRPVLEEEPIQPAATYAPVTQAAPVAAAAPAPEPGPADLDTDAKNWRLVANTDLERRTFALMKTGMGLEEATAAARQSLGIAPGQVIEPQAGAEVDPASPALPAGVPATVAEARTALSQLKREVLEAEELFDTDRKIALQRQILDLEDALPVLQETESHRAEQAAREEAQWQHAAKASLAAVVALNPAAADPASPIRQRMNQIDEAWGEANDPRFGQADKAELIYGIVAKEFGIAAAPAPAPALPGNRQLPTPSRTPQAAPRPGLPVPLAPGAARTTTPDSLSSSVVARAEAIDDPMEYMALMDALQSGQ